MSRAPIYLSLAGGITFTVANVLLAVQADTALLRLVGGLFTVGSLCFMGASLLQLRQKP